MTYLSIIEKFKILFDMLLDFEFILVFTILILLFTFLYAIKLINGKRYMLCMSLSFVVVFAISIFGNYKVLSNTFDNFSTIFFENIYFPSIYVYIGVLVISFISFIVSMLNKMLKKSYKIVNSSMFIINNILFVVILNIIAKNNIDIFSVNSLYTNTSLVAILELSMGLFILWVLSLIVVYATDCICDRLSSKSVRNEDIKVNNNYSPVIEINSEIVNDNTVNNENEFVYAIDNVNVSENIVVENNCNENKIKENKFIFNPVIEINNDDIKESENNNLFDDVLNGNIPVNYYNNDIQVEEYDLINPQTVYENKYSDIKNYIEYDEKKDNITVDTNNEDYTLNNIVNSNAIERTLKEKEKASEERLIVNTISLNDLIDKDDNTIEISEIKTDNFGYTIDDYRKMVKMLRALKIHSNSTNIKIDDAVAISLISNYSIDDCMKLKNMLKGNLV